MERVFPGFCEWSWVQFTDEVSLESIVADGEIDRLLNDPIISDFDLHDDDRDEFEIDDMQRAMDSQADPDGLFALSNSYSW